MKITDSLFKPLFGIDQGAQISPFCKKEILVLQWEDP